MAQADNARIAVFTALWEADTGYRRMARTMARYNRRLSELEGQEDSAAYRAVKRRFRAACRRVRAREDSALLRAGLKP